jgi:predicted dehydrogenase
MSENELSRRRFLTRFGQGVAATSLSAGLLKSAAAQLRVPDPAGKKLGYAIVGLGSLSINQILPAFASCEHSKPVAFVTGHPEKAAKLGPRYGVDPKNVYSYEDYDKLRDNPEVDIIYIVLPNSMHAEYTIRGVKAGKHVLCEKPMATSVADCEAMIAAAKQADRKLMIAYRCQYEPFNREMIRIARAKEFGRLVSIVGDNGFNIGDPTQWRLNRQLAGGGSLMDIGIYGLNAARFITGEEPNEVSAMIYTSPNDPRFKEVEETTHFQLRFPSGTLGSFTTSYGYTSIGRIRAVATEGWFEMEPSMNYTGLRMSLHRGNSTNEVTLPQRDHFALEMEHMSDCVMNNKNPLTPGEEGLRDIRIITAIYEAAKTGKSVKLSG